MINSRTDTWPRDHPTIKLLPPKRDGTGLSVIIRSVPVLKNVFGSTQNPGARQPNQYERYLMHMPEHIGVYIPLRCYPSTSSKDVICSRSVGSFGPPKEEKEVQHFFFLFLDILFFPGCTETIRFSQPISTNSCGKRIFHSVRSNYLWGCF